MAQNEEAKLKHDPVEAFLTLKHITSRTNSHTKLSKLGNIVRDSELEEWPYIDMVKHLQTIDELSTAFCFAGILTLNGKDSNLNLHVRDKRFIPDLTNASVQAHVLNNSRHWHNAGSIGNPAIPILEAQCQEPEEAPRSSKSVQVCSSFRMQLPRHEPPKHNSDDDDCPGCSVKEKEHEIQDGDIPTFFQALSEEISKELADGHFVVWIPQKLFVVGKGRQLQGASAEMFRDYKVTVGLLILVLPTSHEGGGLRIHSGSAKEEFNFAERSKDGSSIQWVTFRSNCKYDVLPVTKGTCTMLMYSIRKVPIILQHVRLCTTCSQYPSGNISRIKTSDTQDPLPSIKKFCQEVRKRVRVGKEKKIGIFLQNRYPMSDLDSEQIVGVDRLMYEELSELDVMLTPVLCYWEVATITNHFVQVKLKSLQEKCVYLFSMEDLQRLQTSRISNKETTQNEEVPFIGSESSAEVVLNKGETVPEGLTIFEDVARTIRWSFRCAMIVSSRKAQKSAEPEGKRKARPGKKRSKRGGRSKSRSRKAEKLTLSTESEKNDEQESDAKDKDETTANVTNENESFTEAEEGARAPIGIMTNEESNDEEHKCSACGKHEIEVDDPLRRCIQCHRTLYCSRKCQRDHWEAGHKYSCGNYANELD